MKSALKIIFLMSLASLALHAQNDPDYQLRALAHMQFPITNGQGIAAWLVAPNLLEPQPKLLAVGGWLIKKEESWKEFMAGVLFNPAAGVSQPVLNLRSYAKGQRLDLYGELMWRPDKGIASSFATYPLGRFRFGLETELTAGLKSSVKSDARLGPRLSFKIPGADRLTITTSAMFGVRGDTVVRTYLLYN